MDRIVPIHHGAKHTLGTFHPIKIHADTEGLNWLKSDQPKMYTWMMDTLIPAVTKHMSDTFRVTEVQNTKVAVDTCSQLTVKSHLKQYHQADLILIFTAEAEKSDGFVAWASPCQLHKTTLRPTAGRVNMNPYHLSYEKKKFFDQFATVLHEIYHIMGFSKSLYQYYVNPNTYKRKRESDTYITNGSGTFKYLIRSPLVLAHAREHFGCSTMQGVPVEDGGGSGSAGSHWEKVVLGNEVMVANQVANPVVSKFTLKLMEDSGWYQINYDMAEPFFWGKGDGCSIMSGDCRYHGNTCQKKGDEGCFYDYTFQAICKDDKFSNYCTFFTGTDFDRHDCRVASNADSNSKNLGEYFGLRSRCFEGQMRSGYRTHGNMCYRSECQGGKVLVRIGSKTYQCLSTGQKIQPTGYDGYVLCPDAQDFCEQDDAVCKNDCTLNGRCVNGNKCYCYPGWSGEYCNKQGGPGGFSSSTSTSTNSNTDGYSGYDNSNTSPSNYGGNSNYNTGGNTSNYSGYNTNTYQPKPKPQPAAPTADCRPSGGFWATLFGSNECDQPATTTSSYNGNSNYGSYGGTTSSNYGGYSNY